MLCGPCTSLGLGPYWAYREGVNASKPPPVTGYALARFQEKPQEFKRDIADASAVSVVWLMRSLNFCGATKTTNENARSATGIRNTFCFDSRSMQANTAIRPTSAPREYVKRHAGIPATNATPKNHFKRRFDSVLARKKRKGSAIFTARPKALLSAIIEFSGPYTRNCPPVRIMDDSAWRTRSPNDPPIASSSHRRRTLELMIPTDTTVMRRIFETKPHRNQASAALSANASVSTLFKVVNVNHSQDRESV